MSSGSTESSRLTPASSQSETLSIRMVRKLVRDKRDLKFVPDFQDRDPPDDILLANAQSWLDGEGRPANLRDLDVVTLEDIDYETERQAYIDAEIPKRQAEEAALLQEWQGIQIKLEALGFTLREFQLMFPESGL